MLVSGIIATAGLSGILIALLAACVVLAIIDQKVDAGRIH
jgi:hypothetical protein